MSKLTQLIGETVGSYKILDVLGEGGMGAVYKAEHVLIGKEVALKILHAQYTEKPQIIHRFFTEARAVNRIGHRNIVDISDYGQTEGGRPYFIMELLTGRELARELERAGAMDTNRALHIIRQIASALSASHKVGIIHRDLKPENIFLLKEGDDPNFVKLLDFGIAKLQETEGRSIHKTKDGQLIGTPAYMAPEQIEGVGVDHRADIYSLGITFYEMLTGEQLFSAESFNQVLATVLTTPIPPPRSKNPHIPPEIEAVILKMVEKRKEDRFQSMTDVIEALSLERQSALSLDHIIPTLPEGPAVSPRAFSRTTLSGAATKIPVTPRRFSQPGVLLGGFLSVVGIFVVGAYLMLDSSQEPTPEAPSTPATDVKANISTPSLQPDTSAALPEPLAPPRASKVSLEFISTPLGATVSEEGKILGRTPFVLKVEPSDTPRTFEISLKGYLTQTRLLTPQSDTTTNLTLTRASTPRSVANARSGTKKGEGAKDKENTKDDPKKKSPYSVGPLDSTTTFTPEFD